MSEFCLAVGRGSVGSVPMLLSACPCGGCRVPSYGKLKLRPGWRYLSMVPEQDLVLGAAGKATVVQDELENTYQKLD